MKKRFILFAVILLLCAFCSAPTYAAVDYESLIASAKQNEEMAKEDVGTIFEGLDYEMAASMYETAATIAPDRKSEADCYLNAARVYIILVSISHDGTRQAANRYDSAAEHYKRVAEITGEYEYYYGLAAEKHLEAAQLPDQKDNAALADVDDVRRRKECDMAAEDYEQLAERTGKNEYYIKAAEIHLAAAKLVVSRSIIVNECELAADDYELAGKPELAAQVRKDKTASVLSEGYPEIACGVGGLAVGFVAAMLIFRRKKAAVSGSSEEDEE